MRIEFEEAKTRPNKIKIGTIIILVILFVSMFAVLGVKYAELFDFFKDISKNNIKEEYRSEDNINKENKIAQIVEQQNNSEEILLPVYTENAKNKMENIFNSDTKVAYLTFDDGPSQAVTTLILDVLKQQNVKATFFVLGANVVNNPEIVKRAYEEGHYIANHGYTHNYKKIYKNAQSVLEEYNKTEKAIQQAIGNNKYSSHLFRFPGGYAGKTYKKVKSEAGKLLNKNDISYIDWNTLTGDAEGANTKEKILENIKNYSANKGNIVVLMHDSASKILTYETLNDVINYLRDEGYTFENFYNIMS